MAFFAGENYIDSSVRAGARRVRRAWRRAPRGARELSTKLSRWNVVCRRGARKKTTMEKSQLTELVLQSLEHERGGVKVYKAALECVVNEDLREEWEKYLEETQTHAERLEQLCRTLEIDPEDQTPGRAVVKEAGASLVRLMSLARGTAEPAAVELVACECVVLAETKDHLDWELLTLAAEKLTGTAAKELREVCEEVSEQEGEHLYHSKGWCRELWIQSLGMSAVLPPPEEQKHVKTAIGASRAEQARDEMK
jgi:hypothetical protein